MRIIYGNVWAKKGLFMVGPGCLHFNKCPLLARELEALYHKRFQYPDFIREATRLSYYFSLDDCEYWACETRKTKGDSMVPYMGTGSFSPRSAQLIIRITDLQAGNQWTLS